MSVASFIASQRTEHRVPHAKCCRWLEVSESWFYKWHDREPTARQQRRAELDAAVRASFEDSGGTPGTYGSPRVFDDLVEAGWKVSVNTVAASMARQGLQGRAPKRKRRCLDPPGQGGSTDPGPGETGLQRRADRSALVWRPDRDPHRRGQALPGHRRGPRLAAAARLRDQRASRLGAWPRRRCAWPLRCAAATSPGSMFHSDKGGEYVGELFAAACRALGVTQSMGRVGSALDNAAAESWNSTLEHELLSRRHFATKDQARRAGRPVHRRLQPAAPPLELRDAPTRRLRSSARQRAAEAAEQERGGMKPASQIAPEPRKRPRMASGCGRMRR